MKNPTKSEQRVEYLTKLGKKYSKDLRKKATKEELILFRLLKDAHIYFKFQHPIICSKKNLYIGDFYLPDIQYFIEVNGSFHYEKDQRKKDNRRKKQLKKEGISVIEFANKQVHHLTKEDVTKIYQNLLKLVKS